MWEMMIYASDEAMDFSTSFANLRAVNFIKQCREFGCWIHGVRKLLDLSVSKDRDCSELRYIAQTHLEEVQAKLRELKAL
jgi:DNA-binding transcriptional MerR regulator